MNSTNPRFPALRHAVLGLLSAALVLAATACKTPETDPADREYPNPGYSPAPDPSPDW